MHDTSTSHTNSKQWVGRFLLPTVVLLFVLFSTLISAPRTGRAQGVPTVPAPGQIAGVVFDDRNGNGVKDAGEPGIANVTVTRVSGPAVTTDGNGNYTFTNVAPGSYTVNVTIPAGFVAGGPTSRTVNVVSGSTTQANFSLLAQGTISGVVFDDRNGNGFLDTGELGIAGVTVNRSSGPSTTTDANGAFRFTSVAPGSYSISILLPAAYAAGGPTSQNVNVSSGGAAGVFFPLLARGVIQGVVFNDRNGNGIHDGEPGIPNVTITRNDGQSVTTDANGVYQFTSVTPGSYTLNLTVPPNHVAGGPTSLTVNVGNGGSAQANFALLVQGVIQGIVFEDLNGNSKKDSGEFGLAGVVVTRSNGPSTTTDANGTYQFTSVTPGDYTIAVNAPTGYVVSGLSSQTVHIPSGGSAQVNFVLRAQGVIQGVVYEDRNSNGQQDGNEPGIGGVVLTRSDGATTTTSSNGSYRFNNVTPGSYSVLATVPADYVAGGPTTVTVNVGNGGSAQANFSFLAKGVIQGVLFQDLNTNGYQDSGEPGIAGITVSIDGGPSQVTDVQGGYRFTGIAPGLYTIRITLPAEYVSNSPTVRTLFVYSGGSVQASFPIATKGTIYGVVFSDLNGNGRNDFGEPGIPGVTVTRSDGETQITSGTGSYRFNSVTPGSYTIHVAVPSNFVAAGVTSQLVNVSSGGSAAASFPMIQKGVVQGTVFEDRNGNGRQDKDELGVGGVTVTRSDGATLVTNSIGGYRFEGVVPGSYTVDIAVPEGFVAGGATSRIVNVAAGGSAQANYALLAKGVIQGVVFDDYNGNGTQDSGEPGIGGVTLTVEGGASTATDTSGGYQLNNVTPGTYTIHLTIPAGYVAGGPVSRVLNIASGGSSQANFALLAQGVIQGVVYEDRNGNGYQDGDEPGVGGVALTQNDNPVGSTDGSGGYRLDNVNPGPYTMKIAVPVGYVAGEPTSRSVNLGSGGSAQANFAILAQGVIQGVVFDDLNGNGVQDTGELGVGGVVITREDGPTTTTNSNGSYQFDNVTPGSYTLNLSVPSGYTTAGSNFATLNVGNGGSAQANFALQAQGVIQGVVFDDINGNSVQDSNEPGISGVEVTNGGSTITTDTNGGYRFEQIDPGNHIVAVTVPPGYTASGPTSLTAFISSGSAAQVNFTLQAQRQIRGVVFDDRNGNGIQEQGEPGISGVTILHVGGSTTQTDTSGGYHFDNVTPGTYTLRMTVPPGYVAPRGTNNYVTVNNENIAQANFSLQETGALQGVVFHDRNSNGKQDRGEPGIGGVIVFGPNGSMATLKDGRYHFANVGAGTYAVQVAVPANYALSSPNPRYVGVPSGGSAQANFGLNSATRGTLYGYVFEDLNSNGIQDGREAGLSGITAQLYVYNLIVDSSGSAFYTSQFVGSTRSTGDGSFRFTNLGANQLYVVYVSPTAGFTSWYGGWGIYTNQLGNSTTSPRFPLLRNNTLSGYVFVDKNANFYFDSTEQGLGGITVELQTTSGTLVATTRTAADGRYQFANVLPPNYNGAQPYIVTVRRNVGTGYNLLSTDPAVVWIYSYYPSTYNFVTQAKGTVAGSAVPGTQLTFSPVARSQSNTQQADTTVIVPASGEYALDDLPPGDYVVTQTPPEGFYAQQQAVSISLSEEQSAQGVFDAQPANSISGLVFEDLNGNGVHDDGETLLGGVEIALRQGETTVQTTTTTIQGQYQFTQLTLGDYTVVETDPAGYISNTPNAVDVTLSESIPVAFANFGDQVGSSITGVVFRDDNVNGRHDAGEEVIPQATVELLPADSNDVITSTVTLLTGDFAFRAVDSGNYRVRVTQLENHHHTTPATVAVVIGDATSSAVVNFGQTTNQKHIHLPVIGNNR